MAETRADLQVLSIGCSCINRFQFDFFSQRHPECPSLFPRGLFDWNIASLEASLRILELAAEGSLDTILRDETQYAVAWETLIVHAALPGLSFFHEDTPRELLSDESLRAAFVGKVSHLAKPFTTPNKDIETHLVWSNVQPNLPDTVKNVIPWADFVLTEERYARALDLAHRIFGDRVSVSFLSTPQDCEIENSAYPNVHLIDLPRGEDFTGEPLLYDPLLRRITKNSF